MTPQEKTLFAQTVALYGIVTESVKEYAETKPAKERERIEYAVDKVRKSMMQLFNAIHYERTRDEVEAMARFADKSRIFLLAPDDADSPEVQALVEKERRWIEAG